MLVFVDDGLGRILAALRWIDARLAAFCEVIDRVASLLACAVAVLVILIVVGVAVEMALLLEITRGV
jgi:hypothetical protein